MKQNITKQLCVAVFDSFAVSAQ